MELQNFRNHNRHLNHINRGRDYQKQQQYQGDVKYNQYDDNSSVGGFSGRKSMQWIQYLNYQEDLHLHHLEM